MSVTYLGLVLILSTKFHPGLSALAFSKISSPPPQMTLDQVRIQNKRSEFQDPSEYEILLRYNHSFIRQKYLIFSNLLELTFPQLPKESRSVPVMSILYLGLVLIFASKIHPGPSTLSVFQDFRFCPPPTSPSLHLVKI